MRLSMELVREQFSHISTIMIFFAPGKDKLAEILSMDSSAAKELMSSFLRKSTHPHIMPFSVTVITIIFALHIERFSGVQTFMQTVVNETRSKGIAIPPLQSSADQLLSVSSILYVYVGRLC